MELSPDVIKLMQRTAEKLQEWLKLEPDEKILTRHKYIGVKKNYIGAEKNIVLSLDEPLEGFGKIRDELRLCGCVNEYQVLKEKFDGVWQLAQKADKQKRIFDKARKKGKQKSDALNIDELFANESLRGAVYDLSQMLQRITELTKQSTERGQGKEQKNEAGKKPKTKMPKKDEIVLKNGISQLWKFQNSLSEYFDELDEYYGQWYKDADEKHFESALVGFTKILSDGYIVRKNLKTIQHLLPPESTIMNIIDQLCKSLEKTQTEVIATQEKIKSLKGLSEDELLIIDYEYPMERLHEGYWDVYENDMNDDLGTHILCLENYFLKERVEWSLTETKQTNPFYLSITDLIKRFQISDSQKGAFRKKIERCRNNKTYGDGFFREIANPRANEPRYEYKTEKVALIVNEIKRE